MSRSVKVTGLDSLQKDLNRLIAALPDMRRQIYERLSKQVLLEGGEPVPSDTGNPSGNWYEQGLDIFHPASSKLEKLAIEEANQLADYIQKSLQK